MTTRREVLLALAKEHDQDVIVAEVVDGVCFLRRPGDALPSVAIPVVPSTIEHAELAQ